MNDRKSAEGEEVTCKRLQKYSFEIEGSPQKYARNPYR